MVEEHDSAICDRVLDTSYSATVNPRDYHLLAFSGHCESVTQSEGEEICVDVEQYSLWSTGPLDSLGALVRVTGFPSRNDGALRAETGAEAVS